MKDPRYSELARNLINYSVELKKGEKILIDNFGGDFLLAKELLNEVYKAGGILFLSIKFNEMLSVLISGCDVEQMKKIASYEITRMSEMQAYIGIRETNNVSDLSSVPQEKMKIYNEFYMKPLHLELRAKKTRWCVLRYPNKSMAQLAGVSTDNFEDFYFKVCNLDYKKMSDAMDNLVNLMHKTDKVHIKGVNTDLIFSIKGMPAIKCKGKRNIPDGEVFSAPVKHSVNGVISYNTPSLYQGFTYENIRLEFKDGKIVNATSNDNERINKVFNTDEGARYVGEFSFGLNPYIEYPMKDTLFDDKIRGSNHFTPGKCYEECDNGNASAIHWDLVYIQRPEFGGSEIWLDDRLIRKDGMFVVDELKCLNPENLK